MLKQYKINLKRIVSSKYVILVICKNYKINVCSKLCGDDMTIYFRI